MSLVWGTTIPIKFTEIFTNRNKEDYDLFGAKPLTKPLPVSVGAASGTRNSNCPICDGMELPPAAGGDEVVSTHAIPGKEHAQRILLDRWNSFFWFSVI